MCLSDSHSHTHTHTQVKAKACMVQPVRIPRATFSLYSYLHREWAEEQAKGASSHGSSLTQQKEWDWGKKGQMTVSRKRGNPITEEPVLNSAQRFYIQPTLLMRWGLPGMCRATMSTLFNIPESQFFSASGLCVHVGHWCVKHPNKRWRDCCGPSAQGKQRF